MPLKVEGWPDFPAALMAARARASASRRLRWAASRRLAIRAVSTVVEVIGPLGPVRRAIARGGGRRGQGFPGWRDCFELVALVQAGLEPDVGVGHLGAG